MNHTEQLRIDLIQIIKIAFSQGEMSQQVSNILTSMCRPVIEFVAREMQQIEWKTLENCLSILGQISGSQSEEICSHILNQPALL